MDPETFALALAPYVVTGLGIVVAGIWGRTALQGKNEVLKVKDQVVAAKEEQLKAIAAAKDEQIATVRAALEDTIRVKDTHIQMLERFRPTDLLEQLSAFVTWNDQLASQLGKSRVEVEASVAKAHAGSEELTKAKKEVARLTSQLEFTEEQRRRAEELADSLRRLPTYAGVLGLVGSGAGAGIFTGTLDMSTTQGNTHISSFLSDYMKPVGSAGGVSTPAPASEAPEAQATKGKAPKPKQTPGSS